MVGNGCEGGAEGRGACDSEARWLRPRSAAKAGGQAGPRGAPPAQQGPLALLARAEVSAAPCAHVRACEAQPSAHHAGSSVRLHQRRLDPVPPGQEEEAPPRSQPPQGPEVSEHWKGRAFLPTNYHREDQAPSQSAAGALGQGPAGAEATPSLPGRPEATPGPGALARLAQGTEHQPVD